MRNVVAGLCAALLLAACAASGIKVTSDQLQGLKRGETTEQEVIARLGPPTSRIRSSDGRTMLVYSYAEVSTRPATFIPVVGLFAGGADARGNTAVLRFDPNSRLIDYTTSETRQGTGLGAAPGWVDAHPAAQPRQ